MITDAEVRFYVTVAATLTLLGWAFSSVLALLAYIPIRLAGIREPLLGRWTRRKWRWLATSLLVCVVCIGTALAEEEQVPWGAAKRAQLVGVATRSMLLWTLVWGGYGVFACVSIGVAMIGLAGKKWFPHVSNRLGLGEHPLLREDKQGREEQA